jgi:hypothetical protein
MSFFYCDKRNNHNLRARLLLALHGIAFKDLYGLTKVLKYFKSNFDITLKVFNFTNIIV